MSYKFADINGVKMHYDVQGQGEALLLIHAGIADLRMWDEQMPIFTKHFRVIRHDVREFGETPDPPGNYTDHGDIKALLKHLNVDSAHVLGISNGGRIAIDFALASPSMMKKLVVVAPGLGGFSSPPDAWLDKMGAKVEKAKTHGDLDKAADLVTQIWFDGPNRNPEQVDINARKRALKLIREWIALPFGEGVGDIERPPAAGRLDEIKATTLLIMGEEDVKKIFPAAEAIEKGIPNIKRVNMPHTAHLPPIEKPEQFNQIVLDFLLER